MFKIVVLLSVLAAVNAGLLGAPLAYSSHVIAAPLVKTAVPVATSYQNTFKISHSAVPVVAAHAPLIAAPALSYHSAPVVGHPIW